MDEQEIQERRRFFHAERVPVATSYCYDYVMYNNGLLKDFPKKSAGNEKVILYYLMRKFNVKDEYGNTTEFKDVAETVWMRHETIAEETGLRVERISEAIKSLAASGILLHEVERGVGQWIALSSAAIEGCQKYSERRLKGKKDPVTETVSGHLRKPEVGSYGNRKQAVTETVSGSYIEDSVKRLSEETQSMDGCKGTHPAKGVELVDIVKEIEPLFANPRSGFVPFKQLNDAFVEIQPSMRPAFAAYLKRCWEENLKGSVDKRPSSYRLSVQRLPTYRQWFKESLAEAH